MTDTMPGFVMKGYIVETYTMDVFTFERKRLTTTFYRYLWLAKLHVLFTRRCIGTAIFSSEIKGVNK